MKDATTGLTKGMSGHIRNRIDNSGQLLPKGTAVGYIEPEGGDEWISIGPGEYRTEKELGAWQLEIEAWCFQNLSSDFFCDWEFGAAQGMEADWYLFCKFSNPEDRFKFILRWG